MLALVLRDRAARAAHLKVLARAGFQVRVATRAAELAKALADGQVALVVHGPEAGDAALVESVPRSHGMPRLALLDATGHAELLAQVTAALGTSRAATLDQATPRRP